MECEIFSIKTYYHKVLCHKKVIFGLGYEIKRYIFYSCIPLLRCVPASRKICCDWRNNTRDIIVLPLYLFLLFYDEGAIPMALNLIKAAAAVVPLPISIKLEYTFRKAVLYHGRGVGTTQSLPFA